MRLVEAGSRKKERGSEYSVFEKLCYKGQEKNWVVAGKLCEERLNFLF